MMMKSVIWWRKPEYPEETTDLRQVTDETENQIGNDRVRRVVLAPIRSPVFNEEIGQDSSEGMT